MSAAHDRQRVAELVELFDRFLALVGVATRRFCGLFPYNHVCRRLQAMLAQSTVRVVVTDDDGRGLAELAVEWHDGELHRVEPRGRPALSWSVPRTRLEHAAAAPWVYLSDPKRLDFAWFADPRTQRPSNAGARRRASPSPGRAALGSSSLPAGLQACVRPGTASSGRTAADPIW